MEESVCFSNSQGLALSGVISYPSRPQNMPMVVMCHGFSSGKNSKTNKLIVESLDRLGIASFRFDFVGHYDSQGSIEDLTISQGVDDLKSAVDYLLRRFQWIDKFRMGLFGTSYGGNVALWYASDNNTFKAIALKAPVSNYAEVRELQLGVQGIQEWKNKGFTFIEGGGGEVKTNFKFYEDSKSRNTYYLVKRIKARCLIIHGDKDDNVPLNQSLLLKEALNGKATLKVIENAGHNFKEPGQSEEVNNLCVQFFRNNLLNQC